MFPIDCQICFIEYDDDEHKIMVGSCGHSLCLACQRSLQAQPCPFCQDSGSFSHAVPNFLAIDMLNNRYDPEVNNGNNIPTRREATHISNGSIHGLWAMVDADRSVCIKAAEDFMVGTKSANLEAPKIVHIPNGFTKILPRRVIPFKPAGDSNTVYITIFYQERMIHGPVGPPMLICSAWPRDRGENVMVTKHVQARPVENGAHW